MIHGFLHEVIAEHNWDFRNCRCECGKWATADHHNGLSRWTDHSEHVADEIMKAARGLRCVFRIRRSR